jgi:peptidoglycan/LPS O-acetylase OafA/YrhL
VLLVAVSVAAYHAIELPLIALGKRITTSDSRSAHRKPQKAATHSDRQ